MRSCDWSGVTKLAASFSAALGSVEKLAARPGLSPDMMCCKTSHAANFSSESVALASGILLLFFHRFSHVAIELEHPKNLLVGKLVIP